jgi:hypothetical protein
VPGSPTGRVRRRADARAFPLRDKHTGEEMFSELSRLLGAFGEILSISTDGDGNICYGWLDERRRNEDGVSCEAWTFACLVWASPGRPRHAKGVYYLEGGVFPQEANRRHIPTQATKEPQ